MVTSQLMAASAQSGGPVESLRGVQASSRRESGPRRRWRSAPLRGMPRCSCHASECPKAAGLVNRAKGRQDGLPLGATVAEHSACVVVRDVSVLLCAGRGVRQDFGATHSADSAGDAHCAHSLQSVSSLAPGGRPALPPSRLLRPGYLAKASLAPLVSSWCTYCHCHCVPCQYLSTDWFGRPGCQITRRPCRPSPPRAHSRGSRRRHSGTL